MRHQLSLGGLVFDGGVNISTPYTLATLSGIGGVGVKRDTVDRESAHGRFPAPGFLDVRTISWSGLILTDTPYEQDHAIRALAGQAGLAEPTRFVSQGAATYWVDVERAEIPDPEILVYGKIASYRCRVEAPGSLLYGETHTYAGTSVQAYHYGNAPAVPDITVTGSMPSGYQVGGPGGAQFIVSAALTSGVTHRLDFTNGWLFRDGVLVQGAVTRAQVFTIPPGAPSTVSLTPVSGSGAMTVKVTDTFN